MIDCICSGSDTKVSMLLSFFYIFFQIEQKNATWYMLIRILHFFPLEIKTFLGTTTLSSDVNIGLSSGKLRKKQEKNE